MTVIGQDEIVDFGALRVRIPAGARLQAEQSGGESQMVRLATDDGQLDLCVLAAPRSSPMWPRMSREVAASQAGKGAQVSIEAGEWGDEVLARTESGLSRYVAKDGPSWMLFGLALGPEQAADRLAATLREAIRGSVVNRGSEPLPVKTALPVTCPGQATDEQPQGAEPLMFRLGATNSPVPPQRTAPKASPQRTAPKAPPQRTAPKASAAAPSAHLRKEPPSRTALWSALACGIVLMIAAASALLISHGTGHPPVTSVLALPVTRPSIPAQQPATAPVPAAPDLPAVPPEQGGPTAPVVTGPTPTTIGAATHPSTPSTATRNQPQHPAARSTLDPVSDDNDHEGNNHEDNDHEGNNHEGNNHGDNDQHHSRHHGHKTATGNDNTSADGPPAGPPAGLSGTLAQLAPDLGWRASAPGQKSGAPAASGDEYGRGPGRIQP